MESSESHTNFDSWSSSTNWIVASGSIRNSITFESSLSLINDDQNDHSTVNFPAKSPLILYTPSPNSTPCEITVTFPQKHEVQQIYIRSTARNYEIYHVSELGGSSEYLCTVHCGIAIRDEEVLHATGIEGVVCAHQKGSTEELTKERERNGSSSLTTSEDDWVEVKLLGTSLVVNGNSSSSSSTKSYEGRMSQKQGGVLEHVEVLDGSFGPIAKGYGGRLAKWFHLNYTARHKDDDDGYSVKLYFAEVIVFMFKFVGPLFCNVVTCLHVDNHDGSETCKCLFPSCDPRIQYPSENAYVDDSLTPVPSFPRLWNTAEMLFKELFWDPGISINRTAWLAKPSWPGGRIPVDKLKGIAYPSNYNLRSGGSSGAEAEIEYLYRSQNTFTNMSKHIPVPKKLLSEVKRQSNGPAEIQKRALAIAKHVEDRKRPRAMIWKN